jgi:hypothetical protein
MVAASGRYWSSYAAVLEINQTVVVLLTMTLSDTVCGNSSSTVYTEHYRNTSAHIMYTVCLY